MEKMIFAFDEERARRDGLNPKDFFLEIEAELEELKAKYRKTVGADGTVTYIGDDPNADWWNIFGCMHIYGMHSENIAKYGTKWLWQYDDGEDLAEDDLYEEDLLEFNVNDKENYTFQKYRRVQS